LYNEVLLSVSIACYFEFRNLTNPLPVRRLGKYIMVNSFHYTADGVCVWGLASDNGYSGLFSLPVYLLLIEVILIQWFWIYSLL